MKVRVRVAYHESWFYAGCGYSTPETEWHKEFGEIGPWHPSPQGLARRYKGDHFDIVKVMGVRLTDLWISAGADLRRLPARIKAQFYMTADSNEIVSFINAMYHLERGGALVPGCKSYDYLKRTYPRKRSTCDA